MKSTYTINGKEITITHKAKEEDKISKVLSMINTSINVSNDNHPDSWKNVHRLTASAYNDMAHSMHIYTLDTWNEINTAIRAFEFFTE